MKIKGTKMTKRPKYSDNKIPGADNKQRRERVGKLLGVEIVEPVDNGDGPFIVLDRYVEKLKRLSGYGET